MLQSIRNVLTGWVAVIFVVLLIIPFAFWGIDSYFGSGANVNVATVNDVDISLAEYQRAYQDMRQQWQEMSPELADQTEFLREQTLDSLIDRVLLLELREELGFRVSDEQVRRAILEIPVFTNPEGFDTVMYQNYLRSMGYSPAQFESLMRDDIALRQLQAGLLETLVVSPVEVRKLAILDNEKRDIVYGRVDFDDVEAGIEVSDAEIQSYYNERTGEFVTPEEVRVAYIRLSIDNIARQIRVDDEDLRAFFADYQANYSITERRKVRQILVYTDDDEDRAAAEAVAQEIYAEVSSGMTFEEAREQYDNEEITVEISDFGFLNPGVLDTEINDVVFSLEPGDISEPIASQYGYQLVTVDEITGGTVPEFEEVRDEVAMDYRRDQAERRFFDLYDELAILTYEHPQTLEVASESLGIPVQESDAITRSGASDAFLDDEKIISAAFSDLVLLDGNNSDLIELDTNEIVVLRVIEHTPEQQTPLEQVRDEIAERIRLEKGSRLTRETGEEIIEKLKEGTSMDALAEEYSIAWTEEKEITRDSYYLDAAILETAFKIRRPETDQPSVDGVQLADGSYAVVAVNTVHDFEPDSLSNEELEPISNYIRQATGSKSWALMLKDLRDRAEVRIYQENL